MSSCIRNSRCPAPVQCNLRTPAGAASPQQPSHPPHSPEDLRAGQETNYTLVPASYNHTLQSFKCSLLHSWSSKNFFSPELEFRQLVKCLTSSQCHKPNHSLQQCSLESASSSIKRRLSCRAVSETEAQQPIAARQPQHCTQERRWVASPTQTALGQRRHCSFTPAMQDEKMLWLLFEQIKEHDF